jgi:hypothetical protein
LYTNYYNLSDVEKDQKDDIEEEKSIKAWNREARRVDT